MAPVRIGTAGWSIPAILKPDFPADGSQLAKYATGMNAVEINSSFYRPHRHQTYERWAASVPPDFRFAVKLPRTITHQRRLKDFWNALGRFGDEVSGLGGKLGVILVQLPPSLAFDADVAETFFTALTAGFPGIACEPRHASWFSDAADALLVRQDVARVAADPPRHPRDGEPGGARRLAYYRWHGAPKIYWSAYGQEKLTLLADRIGQATAQATWCIFDNTAAGAALDDAMRLQTLLQA